MRPNGHSGRCGWNVTNSSALLVNTRLSSIPAERIKSRSPLGSGQHHVDLPAAALRAHQPLAPIEHGRLSAVAGSHLGGIGLDLMSAGFAPNHEPHLRRCSAAQRHRRPAIWLVPVMTIVGRERMPGSAPEPPRPNSRGTKPAMTDVEQRFPTHPASLEAHAHQALDFVRVALEIINCHAVAPPEFGPEIDKRDRAP